MTITIDTTFLDSITKYPSIPTYHELGDRGCLKEGFNVDFKPSDDVIATEKVDGTNARLVIVGAGIQVTNGVDLRERPGWFIGSRQELLTEEHDFVRVDGLGIIEAMHPSVTTSSKINPLHRFLNRAYGVMAIYGEVFGGRSTSKAAKNYSGEGKLGFRIFDVQRIDDVSKLLDYTPEGIGIWRDRGNQPFLDEEQIQEIARSLSVEVTPRITVGTGFVGNIEHTTGWLMEHGAKTLVALDEGGRGESEGIVVRTRDRKKIAKIKVRDYQRTLSARSAQAAKATMTKAES